MPRVLPLCCLALLLTACGQKGDLYLPGPEREAVATPAGGQAAPALQDDEEDEDGAPALPPAGAVTGQ